MSGRRGAARAHRPAATAIGQEVDTAALATGCAAPYPTNAGQQVSRASSSAVDPGRRERRALTADLALVNDLGHSFVVPGPCTGWLDAGLASATIAYQPVTPAVACLGTTGPPGVTRLSRPVLTTYDAWAHAQRARLTWVRWWSSRSIRSTRPRA